MANNESIYQITQDVTSKKKEVRREPIDNPGVVIGWRALSFSFDRPRANKWGRCTIIVVGLKKHFANIS